MAWQGARALTAQISAKAILRPVGRYCWHLAIWERKCTNRALAGFLGGLAPFLIGLYRLDCPWPRLNKLVANNQSRLMIAENLAGHGRAALADNTAAKQREGR